MENLEVVYQVLTDAYEGLNIPEEALREFALHLNRSVFSDKYDLNNIFVEVCEFEEILGADEIQIEIGKGWYVFNGLIKCLDINSYNAKRLLDSFIAYHDVGVFGLIMGDFKKFFTEKEIAEVLEIGKENFIEEVWGVYV